MISFIICTYNRDKYIYECLSRLAQNSCQFSSISSAGTISVKAGAL